MTPGSRIADMATAHPGPAAAWLAIIASTAAAGIVAGDERVWAYLVVCLVLTAVVATADAVAQFSAGLLRLLIAVGTLHLAGGLLSDPGGGPGVLYDFWLLTGVVRYDQAVHALGSIAGTWASWQLIGRYLDLARTPLRAQALIACLGGMGKGAINEMLEFLTASQVPDTSVGDFQNTGWDLVFDLSGCLAAAIFLVQARAPRRTVQRPLRGRRRPRRRRPDPSPSGDSRTQSSTPPRSRFTSGPRERKVLRSLIVGDMTTTLRR